MNNVKKLKPLPFPPQALADGGSPERLADTPGTQSEVRVASRPDVRVFELRVQDPRRHRDNTQTPHKKAVFLQLVEIRVERFIVACGCKASV